MERQLTASATPTPGVRKTEQERKSQQYVLRQHSGFRQLSVFTRHIAPSKKKKKCELLLRMEVSTWEKQMTIMSH